MTYRHPAVVAKMVATLDHITNGRAILGLGAAWMEREHNMYGIPFDTAGIRLAKLAEASAVIRSLFDRPTTTFAGKYYQLKEALAEPKPTQPHLPLMIGGGGERKTLRITARFADMWHGFGTPQEIAHKVQVLRAHCADVGRDPEAILVTVSVTPGVVLRDDPAGVATRLREIAAMHRMSEPPSAERLRTPEEVARRMVEYWKLGVRGFLFGQSAPFDRETLVRLAREVRPRFEQLIA